MDEDKYWEQPEDLVLDEENCETENCETAQEEGSQQGEASVKHEGEAEKGETIGKFKSVEALYDAYNNLEKEFTKKCQRLSEIEKDKIRDEEKINEDVENKLNLFLSTNGEATPFKETLLNKVLESDSLKTMDDPFSFVWAEMVFDNLKNPKEKDSIASNYVLNNDKIKNAIIQNYVNQLAENKSPIKISSSGNRVATNVTTQKPETLSEAKKMLFDLLS